MQPLRAMSFRTTAPEGTGGGKKGRRRTWLLALTAVIVLDGCAVIRRNEAKDTGDRLVRAGFQIEPADTLTDVQPVDALPPLEIVPQTKDGYLVYAYADPYRCQCVYLGDQYAYRRYQRLVASDFLDAVLSVSLL
jgi:hypothetical protein